MGHRATANPTEGTSFWKDALAWGPAITPRLMPRIGLFGAYAGVVAYTHQTLGWVGTNPSHLGYTGGLLAVLLVLRTNAGYDRWWEARKLWGGIVNQSRNVAIKALAYGPSDAWTTMFIRWAATFSHTARLSLRAQRDPQSLERVLDDPEAAAAIIGARHMPTRVATELAHLLHRARSDGGLDGFAFMELDRERALLIDHIGACERILRTPLPRVHSITLRRFIFLYLIAVPLALASSSVVLAVVATMLIAYPLLAIDQIGHELENPFSTDRQSHLPLELICDTIEHDLLALCSTPHRPQTGPANPTSPLRL